MPHGDTRANITPDFETQDLSLSFEQRVRHEIEELGTTSIFNTAALGLIKVKNGVEGLIYEGLEKLC